MTNLTSLVLPLFTALTLAACTTNVQFDDDGNGGRGAGGGGVGGGKPGVCGDFDNETAEQAVTVTLKNASTRTIFLSAQACQTTIGLSLRNPDGEERNWQRYDCAQTTCEEFQEQGYACDLACAMPPVILVEPGGTYETTWSGTLMEPTEMPVSCFHSTQGRQSDGSCDQQIVAPAGTYTLSANAWTTAAGCEGNDCSCQPDATGSCQLQGSPTVDGNAITADATVAYPSATAMTIEFK